MTAEELEQIGQKLKIGDPIFIQLVLVREGEQAITTTGFFNKVEEEILYYFLNWSDIDEKGMVASTQRVVFAEKVEKISRAESKEL